MNKLDIKSLKKKDDFVIIDKEKFKVVFTNAEKGRSFNRNTEDGKNQINSLIKEFEVKDIVYLKQIHSDNVLEYKYSEKSIKDEEGDSIVTNEKKVIVGVFTADCVPIILIDEKKEVIAAIHSGWKGTFKSITFKTIERMKQEYNTDENDITAYIGPHIKKCCYEVSEDLKTNFINEKQLIRCDDLFDGDKLSLEACIVEDLKRAGVNENKINNLDLCTYCSDEIKLHSYRKSNGSYGRMFSFIILK